MVRKSVKKKVRDIEVEYYEKVEDRQRFGLMEIEDLTDILQHPLSIEKLSRNLYEMICNRDFLIGKKMEIVAVTCVYTACRIENYPTPLSEIAEISDIDEKKISNIHRSILKELNISVEPTGPKPFLYRFSKKLSLDSNIRKKALKIIQKTTEKGVANGKSPNGFAAAAIYLASIKCNQKINQKQIAEVAYTSQATIRNIYREQSKAYG